MVKGLGFQEVATSPRPWRFQELLFLPGLAGESRSDPGVRAGLRAEGEAVCGPPLSVGLGGDLARKTWSCQRGPQVQCEGRQRFTTEPPS